jgi:hypothetical protein
MNTRHLSRGAFGSPRVAAYVIGGVLAMIGVVLVCNDELRGTGILALVTGIVLVLAAEVYGALMRRRQQWIEVLPDGFKVIDRTGERELRDYEIVALAYSRAPVLSNGTPVGYTRRCRMWPAQGAVIELQNKYHQGVTDPLAGMIDRVGELLREGFSQALADGVEVRGDGWSLSKTALRCRVGGRDEHLLLHDITAVHPYDQCMGVWVADREDPVVSLPNDGRNVWLLPALIAPYLKPQDPDAPPPAGGLGRLIFRRKAALATVITVGLLAAVLVVCGIAGALVGEGDAQFILFGMGGVGLLLFAVMAHLAKAEFRCQEWGVTSRNLFGRRPLMYRDVAAFTYKAVRHYTNGAYTGTNVQLRFVPKQGCGKTIAHNSHLQGDDGELDNLRDVISQIIAGQMHHRLAAGEEVAWTKNLSFRPEGLVYRPAGFVTRGQATLLPYENYHGYNLHEGYFFLFEKGKDKAVLSESVGEENFFPGFFLLLNLAHASE